MRIREKHVSAGRWYKDLSPNSWHVLGRHTCPLIQVPIVGLLTVLACNEAQAGRLGSPQSGLRRRLRLLLLSFLDFRVTLNYIP